MKAHLLYSDRDIDPRRPLPWNGQALVQDLGLNALFETMARGDKFVFDVVSRFVLLGVDGCIEDILYRQDVLRDCLKNSSVIRELYAVAVEATEEEKKHWLGSILSTYPDAVLRRSIDMITAYLGMLRKLRRISDRCTGDFKSDGWRTLFEVIKRELDDTFFTDSRRHLGQLKFNNGVLLSAKLTKGNKGNHYVLREPPRPAGSWLTRLFAHKPLAYEFSLHPRDEAGARALSELRGRGIALVASALAQSADHVCSFFSMLRTELAFYVGCVNLHEQLVGKGEPICFPSSSPAEERRLSFRGLYDVSLALSMKERVVGSDANADRQDLVIVTGANQGGKSTFLRSIGLAQSMMQCGMFVAAETFCASICDGIFTHYKREEDTAMKSGKLDEELSRMSDIVDHLTPHPLLLFNESFAATNEREGSEIARQILSALVERRVKIVCVTHLYELARGFFQSSDGNVLFLRADRQPDGTRPFKLIEGKPLETSFGEDLYKSIFRLEGPTAGDRPCPHACAVAMNRIGDRRFLYSWQMVKAATQPDPLSTAWRVGDVEWRRSRHSITTPDHATALDIYRLDRRRVHGSWSVMIVSEAWWDEHQRLVRSQVWATHLSGDRNAITAWIEEQAEALPTVGAKARGEADSAQWT